MTTPPTRTAMAGLLCAMLWGNAAAAADPVAVDVIIESFCPCSATWESTFATKIAPHFGSAVQLNRWFDASREGSQHCCDPSTNGRNTTILPIVPRNSSLVTCFHTKVGLHTLHTSQQCVIRFLLLHTSPLHTSPLHTSPSHTSHLTANVSSSHPLFMYILKG